MTHETRIERDVEFVRVECECGWHVFHSTADCDGTTPEPEPDGQLRRQHLRDALDYIDKIEAALFGDTRGRRRSDLLGHAENLRKLAQFESALWAICWLTGRSVTLSIGGGHDVVHHLSVGGWSKDDSPVAFYNNADLATLERRVIEWAELLKARKANEPMPEPEDDR